MRRSLGRALGVLGLLVPVVGSAEVFINELHYDNADADVGEAVEVVATAGEDLSQYSLYFYNGSTGGLSTATSPNPQAIGAGATVSCGADVRIAVVTPNQIENGAQDGIALVAPGGAVVQFLSYEGTLVANAGPASGMGSTDIGVMESGGTPVGSSLQLAGNGTVPADFSWQEAAAATFGGCNTGQTFGTPVDNPPEVVATVPEQDGTLPANHGFTITFSEAVDTNGGWFTLVCGDDIRQADAFDIGGGPVSFSLVPHEDLIEGRECLLAVHPLAITDRDGSPDNMAGPFDLLFTVTAPVANPPPEVVSISPANGSSGFPPPGDITVSFSEPVTLAANAFALACDASTGIALDYPASGTVVAITTGTALAFGDHCSFSINAAAITDADGATLVPVDPVAFTVAEDSAGSYYAQVNTSSPEQLRCSLNAIISGHTAYPYSGGETDTWDILNLADEDPVDSSKILDVYKNESYTKITGGTGAYNREHTWPNTYGFSSSVPGPYTDTHMLHLTNTGYNSDRGSKPFANCDSGCTQRATTPNHGIGGSSDADSNWFNSVGSAERDRSFEVWDAKKGNMARAVMYMAIRYEGKNGEPDLELTDTRSLITSAGSGGKHYMGLLSTLLAWHAMDPPDAAELARNEVVYLFQLNRNPFVDHPEWASMALFQSSQPETCVMGSANSAPVAVDDAYAAIEDQLLSVSLLDGVLDNDTDADADALTAELVAQATNGAVQLAADGSFSYAPAQDFCGSDQFTYRAHDGTAASAVAIAALEVACVNDAPQAVGTLADRTGQVGVAIEPFGVAAGFADVDDGDVLAYSAEGLPPGLSLDAETGMVDGTPAEGAEAGSPYAVTVTASDGALDAQQAFSITIEPAEDRPEALFRNGFED